MNLDMKQTQQFIRCRPPPEHEKTAGGLSCKINATGLASEHRKKCGRPINIKPAAKNSQPRSCQTQPLRQFTARYIVREFYDE